MCLLDECLMLYQHVCIMFCHAVFAMIIFYTATFWLYMRLYDLWHCELHDVM